MGPRSKVRGPRPEVRSPRSKVPALPAGRQSPKSGREKTKIHPTAIVHPDAELPPDVAVGPYAVIGRGVRMGAGCRVGAHAVIEGPTGIGEGNVFFPFCSIGTAPQHMKYAGEATSLRIGRGNTFREFVTVNRGTRHGGGETVVGDHNFLMAYVHIAHDCRLADHIIMANAATRGGHIEVGPYAVIGGLTGIHQFVRIGAYAMVGGLSAVRMDVPPYLLASGDGPKLHGLNLVGLKRHGFSAEQIRRLKQSYQILFRSGLLLKQALQRVRDELAGSPEAMALAKFVEGSERGVSRE
ncbi:MAG: acyl-ACP--UDP-N-acetylglucosamine O-acyltransferase [Nitrospirae bacterium]|nr:acyl-ACP--UDP-N-acetylglucosamine O-acyltransferase [Nitrospirota bacterium]